MLTVEAETSAACADVVDNNKHVGSAKRHPRIKVWIMVGWCELCLVGGQPEKWLDSDCSEKGEAESMPIQLNFRQSWPSVTSALPGHIHEGRRHIAPNHPGCLNARQPIMQERPKTPSRWQLMQPPIGEGRKASPWS